MPGGQRDSDDVDVEDGLKGNGEHPWLAVHHNQLVGHDVVIPRRGEPVDQANDETQRREEDFSRINPKDDHTNCNVEVDHLEE